MTVVKVEMSPRLFVVDEVEGEFKVGDEARFVFGGFSGPDIRGRVRSVKKRTFKQKKPKNIKWSEWKNPETDGAELKIAITKGDVSRLKDAERVQTENASGKLLKSRGVMNLGYKDRLLKRDELQSMFDMAQELIYWAATLKQFTCLGAYGKDPFLQWFGELNDTPENIIEVNKKCADLNQKVKALSEVHFVCVAETGLASIDKDKVKGYAENQCEIRLERGFAFSRYSWGEKVCSIVHELTHWFLDTVDVEEADGKPCLAAGCIRLARSPLHHADALNNADNWGYYICEYRSKSSHTTGRWKYFTEEELDERPPFKETTVYPVDLSLAA